MRPLIKWILVLSLAGCQREPYASRLHHVWGETSVKRDSLLSCNDGTENPLIVSYIKDLALFVMKANPETFKDEYAPENFCFAASFLNGSDASADPDHGLLVLDLRTVLQANSDAAVAAVISHELAHIVLSHGQRSLVETVDNISADLMTNFFIKDANSEYRAAADDYNEKVQHFSPKYIVALDELAKIDVNSLPELAKMRLRYLLTHFQSFKSGSAKLDSAPDRETFLISSLPDAVQLMVYQGDELQKATPFDLTAVFQSIRELHDIFQETWDQVAAKKSALLAAIRKVSPHWGLDKSEAQADEVALELYSRAGLNIKFFYRFPLNFQSESSDKRACRKLIEERTQPERGTEVHPQTCWRAYNLEVTESTLHANELAQLNVTDDRSALFILGERLFVLKKTYLD